VVLTRRPDAQWRLIPDSPLRFYPFAAEVVRLRRPPEDVGSRRHRILTNSATTGAPAAFG